MASKLDPTPGSEPKPAIPGFVKKDVAKRKAKEPPADKFTRDKDELVTEEEYHALMADRPVKFGPKTSGFVRGGGKTNGSPCSHCIHFYESRAAAIAMEKATHGTCELVRESDSRDEVMADDTCKLFSKDGLTLPLLKEESEETPEA
jgi:hypothetical protein